MADTAASYRSIPSAQVRPLRFAAKNITLDAALSLLGIGQDHRAWCLSHRDNRSNVSSAIFLDVLSAVDVFAEWNYKKFRKNILMIDSHPGHIVKLQKRLSVLDACIVDEDDGLISEHFNQGSLSVVECVCLKSVYSTNLTSSPVYHLFTATQTWSQPFSSTPYELTWQPGQPGRFSVRTLHAPSALLTSDMS
jgi:hypothetical protein